MIDVFEYEVDENGNSGGKNVRVVLTQKLFLIPIYLLLQKIFLNVPKFCSLIQF
jgi:hypothetical protein